MTDRMMITIPTMLSFLTCAAVLICNLPMSSTAPLKKIIQKQTEHNSSEIEPQDQESLATYDQRQSGQYNIKVNIKDVKIIYAGREGIEGSLDDDTIYDYGDYDYDPSHLTVSPLPIFGSGSISFTTSKPPKFSTKVSTTTLKYGTKHTTDKPQSTPVVNQSTTPRLPQTTAQIHTTTQDTTAQMVQNHSSETHAPNGMLSTDSSTTVTTENHSTTEKIQTTTVKQPNGIPVKLQQIPPAGYYDYENIPVQVITDPFYKRKY